MTINTNSRQNLFLVSVMFAVLLRVGVFVFAIYSPIANEDGQPVSPLHVQPGMDFSFYMDSLNAYVGGSSNDVVTSFVDHFREGENRVILSGPVFPFVLLLFQYERGNTLPLSFFYLMLSIVIVCLWLWYLYRKDVAWPWLIVFAMVPNPLWFAINISTDLLFSFAFVVFYLMYFGQEWRARDYGGWLLMLCLMILTRPNGVAVLLFVLVDLVLRSEIGRRRLLVVAALGGLVVVSSGVFYYPYFDAFVRASLNIEFFGEAEGAYFEGLYEGLPSWLDIFLSWSLLLVAKVLYFVGLRPSYGDVSVELVMVRAAAGVVLLPGLVYLFWKGGSRDRLLVGIFMLPILAGASQDRYNLPIQPILFLYGTRAYEQLWATLHRKRIDAAPREGQGTGESADGAAV